jgi:hypothetical protein
MPTTSPPEASREPVTAQQWERFVAELQEKLKTNEAEMDRLNSERSVLALDCELGSVAATERINTIAKDAARVTLNLTLTRGAISQAEAKWKARAKLESLDAEVQRRKEISTRMQAYLEECREVDSCMRPVSRASSIGPRAARPREILDASRRASATHSIAARLRSHAGGLLLGLAELPRNGKRGPAPQPLPAAGALRHALLR